MFCLQAWCLHRQRKLQADFPNKNPPFFRWDCRGNRGKALTTLLESLERNDVYLDEPEGSQRRPKVRRKASTAGAHPQDDILNDHGRLLRQLIVIQEEQNRHLQRIDRRLETLETHFQSQQGSQQQAHAPQPQAPQAQPQQRRKEKQVVRRARTTPGICHCSRGGVSDEVLNPYM